MSRPSNAGKEPHFILAGGMNGIGKWLAQGKTYYVKRASHRFAIQHVRKRAWQLVCESGLVPESFDLVITTTPPLQAARILETTQTPLIEQLNTLRPEGCWSLMLVTTKPLDIAPLLTPKTA